MAFLFIVDLFHFILLYFFFISFFVGQGWGTILSQHPKLILEHSPFQTHSFGQVAHEFFNILF
jgi:hypothetical protein